MGFGVCARWETTSQRLSSPGDNFTFTPAELTVAVGTTVVWTNQDDIPHTVTSADSMRFRSQPLDTGDKFSVRFDRPGRFPYFCSLHAHMQSVVIVR